MIRKCVDSLPRSRNPYFFLVRFKNSDAKKDSEPTFMQRFITNNLSNMHQAIEVQISLYEKARDQANRYERTFNRKIPYPPAPKISDHAPICGYKEGMTEDSLSQLPQSVQKILYELKHRRERIQELQVQLDNVTEKFTKLQNQHNETLQQNSQLVTSERSIRKSLHEIDQKYMDLRNEQMDLKQKEREVRDLKQKHAALTQQLARVEDSHKNTILREKEFATRDVEIHRMQKRIERLRAQSPGIVAFSNLCSRILTASTVQEHSNADRAVSEVHRLYANLLQEQFHDHATTIRAPQCLAELCEEYITRSFPMHRFDCVLCCALDKVPGDLREELTTRGFVLQPVGKQTAVYFTQKLGGMGAYGLVLGATAAQEQRTHERKGMDKERLTFRVRPVIAAQTLDAGLRTRVEYHTTKSSGPGGQAANVTETHVTAVLFLDGTEVCRTQSQETRSQAENKRICDERLRTEVLPKWCEKWETQPPVFHLSRFVPEMGPFLLRSSWLHYPRISVPWSTQR